jgi:hypothetical protein
VRSRLLANKAGRERQDAARRLREQRKYGAQVQKTVLADRVNEKRNLMQAVKKHRKGMKSQLEEMLGYVVL